MTIHIVWAHTLSGPIALVVRSHLSPVGPVIPGGCLVAVPLPVAGGSDGGGGDGSHVVPHHQCLPVIVCLLSLFPCPTCSSHWIVLHC
jgi:hypothetical protein